MSSIYDDFEEVIRRHRERDDAAQREAQTAERFDRIESSIGTLAESVEKLVKGSSPQQPPSEPTPGDPPANSDPPEDPAPEPTPPVELPVERVSRETVARIYTGDDEPEEVEYVDAEDGETKKRPGRRKGHPTTWKVETVAPEPPEPPEPPAA